MLIYDIIYLYNPIKPKPETIQSPETASQLDSIKSSEPASQLELIRSPEPASERAHIPDNEPEIKRRIRREERES